MGPPVSMVVPDNNFINAERAIVERLLFVKGENGGLVEPPRPAVGVFGDRLRRFRALLLRACFRPWPMTIDQFLSHYGPRRAAVYRKAWESLLTTPLSAKDAIVDFFVKAENTNLTAKPDAVPRGISPRGPRYGVSLGLFMKPIEACVYKGIAKVYGQPTVMKGYNAKEQGALMQKKWERFVKPCAVGLDASRFDQHVSEEALRFEHSVYNGLMRDGRLAWLLRLQLVNRIVCRVADGWLKLRLRGKRMSGDMNTGLGNCLLMCAMIHAYAEDRGVVVDLANNGDDCVVFMEQRDLERFSRGLDEWFREMGFNMKVEDPVYELEHVDFCQTRPIWTPDGYLMVRDHFVGRTKDVSAFKIRNQFEYEAWCTSVGNSGLAMCGGIPVFQEFYWSIMRAGRGRASKVGMFDEVNGRAMLAKGMARRYQEVHPRTRYSYWLAFGIEPMLQWCIEGYYRDYVPFFAPMKYFVHGFSGPELMAKEWWGYSSGACDPSTVWEG